MALTARELGKRLGVSASSIFTLFQNMNDVKMAARELAFAEFNEMISDYREYTPAFRRIGMQVVAFGMHEPELFKLLFMQEHENACSFDDTVKDLGDVAQVCVELLTTEDGLAPDEAKLVFEEMWTIAYGLGSMCAMKVCDFSDEDLAVRLAVMFVAIMDLVKSGKLKKVQLEIHKKDDETYYNRPISEVIGVGATE